MLLLGPAHPSSKPLNRSLLSVVCLEHQTNAVCICVCTHAGCVFEALTPMLSITASLAHRSPFILAPQEQRSLAQARQVSHSHF